ncbi:putative mitochondrial co-chaperone protein [Neofusicoccum parvum UCRNP2]|uniref:GrpE protein homolog n=2 Tax=Neofusicoccum parvum TaxID=310453 RepID=R1ECA4_BOTPV|nr:putative mitochondrial co-chaperone protein [Neofusicoccum parvum UCRNP2]GME46222.1 Mitochondrial co-chaperone [Neofusicoccum parvum]
MLSRSVFRSSRAASSRLSAQVASASMRAQSPLLRASVAPAAAISPLRVASRWYSESAETNKEEKKDEKKDEQKQEPAETDKLKEQLEAKNKEIVDLKDKYLRSVADFRNLQERTKREIQAAKDFAIQRFARDLVESVDNLDRALSTVPKDKLVEENKDLVTLHDGIKMTDTVLIQTLKKHGLERFDPSVEGEKFDPNIHEAVFQAPMPDKEDGVCFHTQRTGFILNGRVLRPAQVGVVKNS